MDLLLCFTLDPLNKKKLHEHLSGGGEGSSGPLPSTFDTIHPIDMIFGTNNELRSHFQLNVTTRCLTGFHGNHGYINGVTNGFLSF